MFRLIAAFVMVLCVVVPAQAQCGGGWSSGCGGGWSSGYSSCGGWSSGYSYGSCGGYAYDVCGTVISDGCNECAPSVSDATQPTSDPATQSTPLPPDYYDEEPKQAAQPESEKPKAPSKLLHPTSLTKTFTAKVGNGAIILHTIPTAKVWINGRLTKTAGAERKYYSQNLMEGKKYTYHIMVEENGRRRAGDVSLVMGQTRVVR